MPKLLAEFLQEQQEPFVLDVYLLERGYYRHIIRPDAPSRSPRFSQNKRHLQAIPSCAQFVRTVFSRLLLQHNNHKINKLDHADEDEFSSANSTTLYNSCSESDAECITKQSDFSLQLSPVSVLEETESEGSPLYKKQYNLKKTQGESSTSISRCKSKQATHNRVVDSFDQYSINKRALQQTKQLLVDCVREVIENQRKRDDEGGLQLKKILGAEELWKVVSENVWLWSQEPIHETNIVHLLNSDFMASLEESKSASDQLKDEISLEIADAILEDIINEIVTCL
ncbi:hypothetical protein C2S51_037141 [Perilla frutescens var. frutescens]|nr:hypothetical protein C2S51_037141 [Perilla frutescens var. frutescens]